MKREQTVELILLHHGQLTCGGIPSTDTAELRGKVDIPPASTIEVGRTANQEAELSVSAMTNQKSDRVRDDSLPELVTFPKGHHYIRQIIHHCPSCAVHQVQRRYVVGFSKLVSIRESIQVSL